MCVRAHTSYVVCEDAPQVRCQKKLDSLRSLSKPCLGQVLLDIFLQSYLYPTASEATWAISYILKLTEMSIPQNNFLKLSTQKRDV